MKGKKRSFRQKGVAELVTRTPGPWGAGNKRENLLVPSQREGLQHEGNLWLSFKKIWRHHQSSDKKVTVWCERGGWPAAISWSPHIPRRRQGQLIAHEPTKTCYMPAEAKVTGADRTNDSLGLSHGCFNFSERGASQKEGVRRQTLERLDKHSFWLGIPGKDYINSGKVETWERRSVHLYKKIKLHYCLLESVIMKVIRKTTLIFQRKQGIFKGHWASIQGPGVWCCFCCWCIECQTCNHFRFQFLHQSSQKFGLNNS